MNQEIENLSGSLEKEIKENFGFKEEALIGLLKEHPRAVQIMGAQSLVFETDKALIFPTPVSPKDEAADPELADKAFRGRVARHTVAVGVTMDLWLEALIEAGAVEIDDKAHFLATEALILHDLKKIEEIKLRKALGSSDLAYDIAGEHLADLLTKMGYPEEYVQLTGSLAHNGARGFLTAPYLWPLVRQCAYLSDEFVQEISIQSDILSKVKRLKNDSRYMEANLGGFPERKDYPTFVLPDGGLRPKYDIQEEATITMAKNVSSVLGIGWESLGRFLIKRAYEEGIYDAVFA